MARFSRSIAFVLSVAFCGLSAIAEGASPWLSTGTLAGEAAGLDDGYVHFGGFVPLVKPSEQVLIFADGSLLLYNEGSDALGGNAGLGGRFYSDSLDRILGGYIYYDHRDLGFGEVGQVGFGLESLGRLWDARLNVNLPTSDTPWTVFTSPPTFAGGGLVVDSVERQPLGVVEGELGRVIADWGHTQLRAFVGAYGLFDNPTGDTAGVRSRIEARINDRLWLGGYLEHDDVFDTTGGFTAEWRFGKGPGRSNNPGNNLLARLSDPVVRRRHIAIGERELNGVALTSGGTAITVTHVDEDTPSDPTVAAGTFENPHLLLDNATGATTDIVYVHGGIYSGESLTVTHDGQSVFAASRDAVVRADQGVFVIEGSEAVLISPTSRNPFVINASNVTLSGFEIGSAITMIEIINATGTVIVGNTLSVPFYGIVANSGSSDTTIIDNTFIGAVTAVRLEGASTSGIIQGNTFTNNGTAVRSFGDYTGSIRDNVITALPFFTDANIAIEGDLIGDFAGNTVTGGGRSGGSAVFVNGNVGGFTANSVSGSDAGGVFIGGAVLGAVSGNNFSDNGGTGFRLVGDLGNNFTGNTVSNNGANGVQIDGNVSGGVFGNTANNNSGDGIRVDGVISGATSPNTTEGNGGLGFRN